jgi:transposase
MQEQWFDYAAHQIALQEMVEAVRISKERVERLEKVIEEFVPDWSLGPVVRALQTLRGVDLIVAVTFATEVGDVTRFESPRQLMGYLGLVPGERSTGETVRRGAITKAGNGRVRHMLVESAWTYRHPPKLGVRKLYLLREAPPAVRETAWKAQSRLTARYRLLAARGKRTTVICTAIARKLAGTSCGCCEGGAGDQDIGHCSELAPRAWAEAGQRQVNIRQPLCGPTPVVR